MKLRNKKTGEIGRLYFDHQLIDPKTGTYAIVIQHRDKLGFEAFANYFTLAELNADWEDYQSAEPLIKDEKIRKAVRAWAEANDVLEVFADRIGDETYMELYDEDDGRRRISALRPAGLKTGEAYSIAELCGEEETPESLEPTFVDLDERIREKEEE